MVWIKIRLDWPREDPKNGDTWPSSAPPMSLMNALLQSYMTRVAGVHFMGEDSRSKGTSLSPGAELGFNPEAWLQDSLTSQGNMGTNSEGK